MEAAGDYLCGEAVSNPAQSALGSKGGAGGADTVVIMSYFVADVSLY